nr:cytochrome c oxidase subunit II-like, transmembrane domain-containing protein [Tanacetum cinerariifolium]
MMAPPNDEIVPSHSSSKGPSHSPSWKEDSFEINVLLEESETEGTSAHSLGDDSPYLLGKAKGTYWSDIRLMLEHAPSQNEYNWLLESENKDLQICELQHECFRLFEGFLKQNPPLSDQEDSFEINVLLEESETEGTSARSSGAARDEAGPSRQDYVVINRSFEASMRNRILRLEQDDSPYLLGKAKGTYWSDIRLMLEHAPSQNEYNRLLKFKNKDLQIRELQHECFRLFEGFLKQNPPLSDQVPYNPQEAFKDFLNEDYEKRDQRFPFLIFDRDEKELDFLSNVR